MTKLIRSAVRQTNSQKKKGICGGCCFKTISGCISVQECLIRKGYIFTLKKKNK